MTLFSWQWYSLVSVSSGVHDAVQSGLYKPPSLKPRPLLISPRQTMASNNLTAVDNMTLGQKISYSYM
jgi:hypothetical protein